MSKLCFSTKVHYNSVMTITQMTALAEEVRQLYAQLNRARGEKAWDVSAYAQGLASDVGRLNELVMMRQGFRNPLPNTDMQLAHKINDSLWAILVLAAQCKVNLESTFPETMKQLRAEITKELASDQR